MQRAGSSGERTPLVQPTYVFESSVARRYQKRLRNFQCVICFCIITLMAAALLVTVSYNISGADSDNATVPAADVAPGADVAPAGNLTLLRLAPGAASPPPADMLLLADSSLGPLLQQQWPLKGTPSPEWAGGGAPAAAELEAAVARGRAALQRRQALEAARAPLPPDSPAKRAQRAASTSKDVKPLADAGYAAEQATRALLDGLSPVGGSVGQGPAVNGSFLPLRYCQAAPAAACPAARRFRSVDGSCNNLQQPLRWGVAGTPFRRLLPPNYGDGISSPRQGADGGPLPSARDVSVTVHRPSYAHDTAFTVMLAVWGQFIDHDITATALSKGQNSSSLSCCDPSQPPHPECFPVPLDPEDPFYQQYNLTCMEFVRSAPAPTCHFGPREQLNQATAFLDGSTVYGFSEKRAARLRTFSGGQLSMLQVGGRELLPPSTDPDDGCNTAEMTAKGRYCFESGDDRANENLHLTTMHLVWARQHNALATRLARLNPAWDDERLFQEARRVVGAQMQHITYNEFLPLVLGSDVMWALNLTLQPAGQWAGYDADVDPSIANHFSAAAFRFAHTLLPGLIHNADLSTGSLSYVQLHRMLFNPYALYGPDGAVAAVTSAIITPIHGVDPHVTSELSEHLFEQPGSALAGNATLLKPRPCGLDLVSLNIQRGRDHGLRGYAWWREACGFPRPQSFDDLREVFDESSFSRITTIYRSVEDVDLYTGALAEAPGGRLLGATLTCLVADQFLRLKRGDRFWYETDDPVTGFTPEQLAEIRKTTLAGVLCANEVMLDSAQPRVMQAVDAANPLVDCRELPQPDLAPWAQPPSKPSKKKKNK